MSSYTVTDLKEAIRIALDENASSSTLVNLGDVDTLKLDELIESKIEDASRAVVMSVPVSALSDMAYSYTGSLSVVRMAAPVCLGLVLPLDFQRLVRLQLSCWEYPVYEALPPSSPLYLRCQSPYGVCGTKQRPLAFLVPTGDNRKMLEMHSASSPSNDTLTSCLYVKRPKIENGTLILSEDIMRPVVYYAAYLVAQTLKETDLAERLLLISKSLSDVENN